MAMSEMEKLMSGFETKSRTTFSSPEAEEFKSEMDKLMSAPDFTTYYFKFPQPDGTTKEIELRFDKEAHCYTRI